MKPPHIPLLQVKGTEVYPATLLVAKLFWLVLFAHYVLFKFEVPFLPLWSWFEVLAPVQYPFSLGLQLLFFFGGLSILFNVRPRWGMIAVGVAIACLLLGNRTHYRNHLFITVCVFLLGALHRKNEPPSLLIWQMAVVYLFAGLNKAWEPDWRSGQFFDAWLGGWIGWYDALAAHFPERVFGAILAWSTITFELLLGILFLIPRYRRLTVWLAAGFHFGLFILVKGAMFGFFLHNAMILLLAFVPWESGREARLKVPPRAVGFVSALLRWLDHDHHIRVKAGLAGAPWRLRVSPELELSGLGAVRGACFRLPILWFALTGAALVAPRLVSAEAFHLGASTCFLLAWFFSFPKNSFSAVPNPTNR